MYVEKVKYVSISTIALYFTYKNLIKSLLYLT